MGSSNSTEVKQTMASFTEFCNETTQETHANVKVRCQSTNAVSLLTGGAAYCGSDASAFECIQFPCNIDIQQSASSICSADGQTTAELSSDISRNLKETMDGFVSTLSETQKRMFQATFDATKTSIDSFEQMTTKISTVVSQKSTSLCEGQAQAINESKIALCGKYAGSISINQNATTQFVASCINSAVLNAFETDTELKEFANELDSQSKVKGGGIPIWVWLIIAGVVVVVVIILVMILRPKAPPTTVPYQPPASPVIMMPGQAPPRPPTSAPLPPPTSAPRPPPTSAPRPPPATGNPAPAQTIVASVAVPRAAPPAPVKAQVRVPTSAQVSVQGAPPAPPGAL